jgi:hypothetical protein
MWSMARMVVCVSGAYYRRASDEPAAEALAGASWKGFAVSLTDRSSNGLDERSI